MAYNEVPPPYSKTPLNTAAFAPSAPPPRGYVPLVAPTVRSQPAIPQYGSVTVLHPAPATQVIIVGGCPACRVGVLEDDYSCLGIICAIVFFPLGILCCLASRRRRCRNCLAFF